MTHEATLLSDYAAHRSEKAFSELVHRYLPLVYSAAMRRLDGDSHAAADVTQLVFTALARDAARLSRHKALEGWLYTATRNAVIDVVRAEKRRRVREQEAHIMQITAGEEETPANWEKLKPVIDEAMDRLSERDREAVLLRFFQGRQFVEIAAVLDLSEEAARKRVGRALEKLGAALRRRGITSASVALATLLASEAAVAAPPGLAASIVGAGLASGATTGALIFMTTTKLVTGIGAAVLIGGTVGLVSQQRTIAALRETEETTRRQVAAVSAENAANAKLRGKAETDLAKLRSELAALKNAVREKPEAPTSTATVLLGAMGGAAGQRSVPDSAARQQEKAQLHRRYDPFLIRQRGLPPEQADRFVELKIRQAEARSDLQAAVEQAGLRGDADGIEALRSKLYAPTVQAMQELLGPDGYAAYHDYEGTSAYRLSYVEPMTPMFSAANAALSPEQEDQLVRVLMTNTRLDRAKPTDIGSRRRIDWEAVAVQAGAILTPAQVSVLRVYGNREKTEK